MNKKELAIQIFKGAVRNVNPENLILEMVRLEGDVLTFPGLDFHFGKTEKIFVIGAGKATASMASGIERILGSRISEGHIVVKYGHARELRYITITEASHPVPDHNGFIATGRILGITDKAGGNDLVICLISGGGSALFVDYPEGSGENDVIILNELLVRCGADIAEINSVRKHLSRIKGGQLARSVYPATLVNLMLSDVPGDEPDIIASGPACPDRSTFDDAMDVVRRYGLEDKLPASLLDHLLRGKAGTIDETPKPDDHIFERCHNIIAGNNMKALEGAYRTAESLGLKAIIADFNLTGTVEDAARYIIDTSLSYRNDTSFTRPACILFGGETTVTVTGKGKGGRNQHLALLCAELISGEKGITLLAAGTDGTDGPTEAAGAVVDPYVFREASVKGLDPHDYISSHDSYNFFSDNGGLVITGPTGTNVMDIVVVILA